MNLGDVMDDLGQALTYVPEVLDEDDPEIVETPARGIQGLRIFPYWAERITPPAAVVQWPDPYSYDSTFARGADEVTLPITVMVGRLDARSSRDAVARFADGSGADSVKVAIESYEPTAYGAARVASVAFESISVASVEYLAATFQVNIIGSGA